MNVYFVLCTWRQHRGWRFCAGVHSGLALPGGPVTLPLSLAPAWWRDVDFRISSSLGMESTPGCPITMFSKGAKRSSSFSTFTV